MLVCLRQRHRDVKVGRMRWLSEQELMTKYNQDAAIVKEIVARKIAAGCVRPHPDLPDQKLYHVWFSDEEAHEDEVIQEAEVHLDVGVNKELLAAFWADNQQMSGAAPGAAPHGARKPKAPPKAKPELSPAEQTNADAKKLHKALVGAAATVRQWITTVQTSDFVAAAMKATLDADLKGALDKLEATISVHMQIMCIHGCGDSSSQLASVIKAVMLSACW